MGGFRMDPRAKAKIEAAALKARAEVLEEIAEDARRLAPKDTGELAASIHANPAEGTVTASAEHSVYLELGTEHMDAQPYLRPALYRKRRLS